MPKTVDRPRDDVDAQQMQRGQADLSENDRGGQMGDAASSDEASGEQAPA